MIRWLELVRTPDDTLPPFGDFDNGRGFMLAPSLNFWNATGLAAVAEAILEHEIPFELPQLNEEAFWLLTEKEWDSMRLRKRVTDRKSCIVLKESGHIVFRGGLPSEKNYCFFRAGEFGMGGGGFSYHSHNDLFSPLIYLNGVPILADTGTSVYLGNDADRDYLRSAAAHNTTFASSWNLFRTKRGLGWNKVTNGKFRELDKSPDRIAIECGYRKRQILYKRTISWIEATSTFQIEDHFTDATEGVH